MKTILVTGAGGSPATNFIRSLRLAKESFKIIGTDCDKYLLQRSEADKNYLVPICRSKDYLKHLNYIIKKEKIDFLHAQNDDEIRVVSENREKLLAKTFLPRKETVKICQNKFKSSEIWRQADLIQPKSFFIRWYKDLQKAFLRSPGSLVWLREQSGAGGKGSLATSDFDQAKAWIDFNQGWGKFIAAEYLSPNSVTFQSIWADGELIVAQSRKRLYWELGKIAPSGVSGATGAGMTISDRKLSRMAIRAIKAIDRQPDGIFSVDLTYNHQGVPVPTEINIARFFTTHVFFTEAGLNMPLIYIKLAFKERLPLIKKVINPLPSGLVWIRGIDFLPILTNAKRIETYVKSYNNRRKRLAG